jgi:hypothetical protein
LFNCYKLRNPNIKTNMDKIILDFNLNRFCKIIKIITK